MILEKAKKVLEQEGAALTRLAAEIGEGFVGAVKILMATKGKIVVVGMGKSGLIGRKIAATLSSTGSPAIFLHAAESLHGDIGTIDSNDAVIIISNSGMTDEIGMVLPALKRIGVKMVAITGNRKSDLARNCDAVIEVIIEKEACPMNLVPTTSTTAMLAVGDAIAISMLEEKGFKPEDFASLHPGGTLGKKLLLKVADIIGKSGSNPVVASGSTVKDALIEMTRGRLGATSIIDETGLLLGYFTDGDLRRHLQESPSILEKKIDEIMTCNPTTISSECLVIEAREILSSHSFDNIPVVDKDGRPIGILDERDIIREGL